MCWLKALSIRLHGSERRRSCAPDIPASSSGRRFSCSVDGFTGLEKHNRTELASFGLVNGGD